MIAARLRDRRIKMGLDIRDLSASASISAQHLRDIETGRRAPSLKTLLLLTDLLALPTSAWLEGYLVEESRLLPLIQIGEYLFRVGDLIGTAAVLKRLRSLRSLVRENQRDQGRIFHLWGMLTYRESRFARSLVWFLRAERAAKHSKDSKRVADAAYNAALAMMKTGLLSQAVAKFGEAMGSYERLGDQRKAAYARLTTANTLLEMQSYREALPMYRRAAHALRGDPWYFDCKLGEAICLWRTRSPVSALESLVSLEKFAQDADRQARYHHNLGVIYRQLGALDDAIAHLDIALKESTASQPPRPEFFAEMCLCRVLVRDVTGAAEMLDEFNAFAGAKDPQDVLAMAILSYVLGRAPFVEPLPRYVTDGYEQRLIAAVDLLRPGAA